MMRVEISEGKWWVGYLEKKADEFAALTKMVLRKMDSLFIIDDWICAHYLNIPGPVIAKSLYCISNA